MKNIFLEQAYIEKVIKKLSRLGSMFRCETLAEVKVKDKTFPIYGIEIGPQDKDLPVLGLFGGVHGLEKIGTHVIANYMNAFANKMAWDSSLVKNFEGVRIVSIPIVNPGGMYLNRRSNPNGVDLMRNAPTEAEKGALFLASGQTYTKWLPWYRGNPQDMELENKVLKKFVSEKMFSSPFSMALDIHSGFGLKDRLWYPYAKTMKAFPDENLTKKFARYLKVSHPYHQYKVEKQSDSYLIHGDVWDHLYDEHCKQSLGIKKFLPWTLELGSWSWLLSRPHHIFKASGLFHTNDIDRYAVIMRKHWGLLDFFRNMSINHKSWTSQKLSKEKLNRVVGL